MNTTLIAARIEVLEKELHMLRISLVHTLEEERARAVRVDHERSRVLTAHGTTINFDAVATWPVPTSGGIKMWEIGVGMKGKLLAIYKIHEYRGRFVASVLSNEPVPDCVDLAVRMAFDLRSKR